MIEEPQVVVHEADEPDLVGHLLDADVLASEYGAEMDLVPFEADPSALRDRDRLVMERVVQLLQAATAPTVSPIGSRASQFMWIPSMWSLLSSPSVGLMLHRRASEKKAELVASWGVGP